MNDRYLYRAKRKDNGEWVVGSYVYTFAPDKKCHVVGVMTENYWIVEENGNMVLVDKDTICQCTGLKDKNGKLIWENDIVELYDRNKDYRWMAVVTFGNPNCEYTCGWQLKPIGECEANTDILCWIDMEESGAFCEVIGSSIDNPELLEVGE